MVATRGVTAGVASDNNSVDTVGTSETEAGQASAVAAMPQVDLSGITVARDQSTFFFFYPFWFDPTQFAAHAKAVEAARWPRSKGGSFEVWEPWRFGQRNQVLPHLAKYFEPVLKNEPESGNQSKGVVPPASMSSSLGNRATPTARLWQLTTSALQSHDGLGGHRDIDWNLQLTGARKVGFEVPAMQLVLFHLGIGMLVIEAKPTQGNDSGTKSQIAAWLDVLHYLRFARRGDVAICARRHPVKGAASAVAPEFWPTPAGGSARHPDGTGQLIEIIEALLRTGAVEPGFFGELFKGSRSDEQPNWWQDDIFVHDRLIPFAVLFCHGVRDSQISDLKYRVRNLFHSEQLVDPAEDHPTTADQAVLPYGAKRQWFFFSRDGGEFLACDPLDTPFWTATLPDHLRTAYRFVFLFVLYQRFLLLALSDRVAGHWLDRKKRYRVFGQIRHAFLDFTARGEFGQIMRLEHHHRFYKKWQEVLEVQALYNEVKDEVYEMQQWLVDNGTRRLERRVGLLGIWIGVPTMIGAVIATGIGGLTDQLKQASLADAAKLVLGLALLLVLLTILVGRQSTND
jgi:hypothetical protein